MNSQKSRLSIIIIIFIVIFCILDVVMGAMIAKKKLETSKQGQKTEEDQETEEGQETGTQEKEEGQEAEEGQEMAVVDIGALLSAVTDQVTQGQQKLQNGDIANACTELSNALASYLDIAVQNDAFDEANPLVGTAFSSYSEAILQQVRILYDQMPSTGLYRQIEMTLKDSLNLASELQSSGFDINSDELQQRLDNFPESYKEKYILTINELRLGDDWSRTTAWQYMQDASSIGLVNTEVPDDPLTLRYAYALAWINQRDIAESLKDGSITKQDAMDTIMDVIAITEYNPILMRDLAVYLEDAGDTESASIIKDALDDVWNYLAYTENVYIVPEDMLVVGKVSRKAHSNIALDDFWYFNTPGSNYSISDTNGISDEGRQHVREIFSEAINQINL